MLEHDALARRAQPKRLVSRKVLVSAGMITLVALSALAAASVRSCTPRARCQSAMPWVCPP